MDVQDCVRNDQVSLTSYEAGGQPGVEGLIVQGQPGAVRLIKQQTSAVWPKFAMS